MTLRNLNDVILKSYGFLAPTRPADKLAYAVIALLALVFLLTSNILDFLVFVACILAVIVVLGRREVELLKSGIDKSIERLKEMDTEQNKRLEQAEKRLAAGGAMSDSHGSEMKISPEEQVAKLHLRVVKEPEIRKYWFGWVKPMIADGEVPWASAI